MAPCLYNVITSEESWIKEPKTKRQSSEWHSSASPCPERQDWANPKWKRCSLSFLTSKASSTMNSFHLDKPSTPGFMWKCSIDSNERSIRSDKTSQPTGSCTTTTSRLTLPFSREQLPDQGQHLNASAAILQTRYAPPPPRLFLFPSLKKVKQPKIGMIPFYWQWIDIKLFNWIFRTHIQCSSSAVKLISSKTSFTADDEHSICVRNIQLNNFISIHCQ